MESSYFKDTHKDLQFREKAKFKSLDWNEPPGGGAAPAPGRGAHRAAGDGARGLRRRSFRENDRVILRTIVSRSVV